MRVGRRIRLKCAACGRGNFLNPERKVADTEISGYVRTGPCADTAEIRFLRPDTVFCGSAVHLNKTTKCRQF